MTLSQQLKVILIQAPKSLTQIKKNSAIWLSLYFIAGLIVFSVFMGLLLDNQDAIKKAFLDYFFPESWHAISETLANFFFESQTKIVIGNMIIGASLVIASIFLFPIKEKYSACFEEDVQLLGDKPKEFPLIYQAWEEVKLLFLYLTAQVVILWIGYYPYAWTSWLSITLSYLFLFFTFGLDFISPTLQRHRITYASIIKALSKRFIATSVFGLIFSLPVVLLSQWILTLDDLTLIEVSRILFLTNLIFLTLAVPVGTYIAGEFFSFVKETKVPNPTNNKIAWSVLSIILVTGLFLHGQLIKSLHHKSQILKADYTPNWSSIDFNGPTLSQMMSGKLLGSFSMNMMIKNPTQFPIVIENSQIIIKKSGDKVAMVQLTGFDIPAGQERDVKLQFDSVANLPAFSDFSFKDLTLDDLNPENIDFTSLFKEWQIDLYVDIWPGIPFILNITK